jgi:hypothetical protein
MSKSIYTAHHSGVWALAWAQVVIFIAMACHVADSQPSRAPQPIFAFPQGFFATRMFCRKDVLPQGNGGTNALVGTRLSFIEEDIKAKLCRPLHGLKQNC